MSYTTLTKYGIQCINKYEENDNINIIDYQEKLDHDGYDKYGPESDLWDLFILYKNKVSGEHFVDWYNWEDWYIKDSIKGYTLYNTFNMNELRNNKKSIIEEKIFKMFK
jgi:hypothetical protein